jgi:DMSO/TMAO reductase YedYZ molybdopterin-dependent catalytic subunit
MSDFDVQREIARKTRRSFLVGGVAAVAGAGAWQWLRTRRLDEGVQWPLRIGLRADEQLSRDYFSENRLARTFPASAVETGRPNGEIGIEDDPEPDWKLEFQDRALSLDNIKALPKITMVTELKCIEGWTRVLQWGGARFSDFVARYVEHRPNPNWYAGLETPDGDYYVGLDMASAMHPQTLLCYEMNGQALERIHGAPLRVVIPVKYGIKNLKRIGKISFSPTRPPDYWAERGYDWYAGF